MILEESKSIFAKMNRNDAFCRSFAPRDWGYGKDDIGDDNMFVLQYAFRAMFASVSET